MYTLTLTNKNNKKLVFNGLNASYNITNIQGLSPAKATINTTQAALVDGAIYNSAKVNMRSINIAFTIEEPVEVNRLNIYQVLRVKGPIKVNYSSPNIDVFIEGYIESLDVGHFDKKQKATVSILCPAPYFKSAQEIINEISFTTARFHFPFSNPVGETSVVFGVISAVARAAVPNGGGIDTGLIFEVYAKDYCDNPTIYNYMTGESFGVNVSFWPGDTLIINTNTGEKSVTLVREGIESNLFNDIIEGSKWLTLPPEGAVFVYTLGEGDTGAVLISIKHYDLYEGV